MNQNYTDIYDYIKKAETEFDLPITVYEGYDWGMKKHIKDAIVYKNGELLTGKKDETPVKNIILAILNTQYRAEDIDQKNIDIYVDDPDYYHLSFLIKKYYQDHFSREHDIDMFLDDAKEEKTDFGGALIEKSNEACPHVVRAKNIAFCDQTSILSSPIGIKFTMSPDELREMEKYGWGKKGATATIEETITLCQQEKKEGYQQNKTPGKQIEVYQVWGTLPKAFLGDEYQDEQDEWVRQLHFVCFYEDEHKNRNGITLYRQRDKQERFKFITRDKIPGRAFGRGAIEELVESQVWTNFSMIHKKNFLEGASKVIIKTTDKAFAQRNNVRRMKNLEVVHVEGEAGQLDTYPRNFPLFDKAVNEWEEYARTLGGATDPLLGVPSPSGTPFRAQERQVFEGKAIHDYRKGKFAKDIEKIFNDWIIPKCVEEIANGKTFLAELSADEMQYVVDCLVRTQVSERSVENVLNGLPPVNDQERAMMEEQIRNDLTSRGNKVFFEFLKSDLKKAAVKVKVNVAGKSKDLASVTDKLSRVFQTVLSNPAILNDPRAEKVFMKIIEYSGLEPTDFTTNRKSYSQVSPIQPEMQQMMMPEQQMMV